MPSKGKRVASRQSNLRRRRGSANRNPATGTNAPTAPAATAATPAPAPARAVPSQPIGQPRGRRFERPAAYNYVGSELRRIGIFSGVLLAVLIGVSFVL